MHAEAKYTVQRWDEDDIDDLSIPEKREGMKVTRARVLYALTGEINGECFEEYLMYYRRFDAEDKTKANAIYLGLINFHGSVHGKTGSFLMQDSGIFESGTASSNLRIIPGSGSGEFKHIRGSGKYLANPGGFRFELDYDISAAASAA